MSIQKSMKRRIFYRLRFALRTRASPEIDATKIISMTAGFALALLKGAPDLKGGWAGFGRELSRTEIMSGQPKLQLLHLIW